MVNQSLFFYKKKNRNLNQFFLFFQALNESSQGSPSVRAMAAKRALQSALNLQQIVDNDNDDEDELNRSPTQKRHRKYKRIGENALITIRKGGLLQHPVS